MSKRQRSFPAELNTEEARRAEIWVEGVRIKIWTPTQWEALQPVFNQIDQEIEEAGLDFKNETHADKIGGIALDRAAEIISISLNLRLEEVQKWDFFKKDNIANAIFHFNSRFGNLIDPLKNIPKS